MAHLSRRSSTGRPWWGRKDVVGRRVGYVAATRWGSPFQRAIKAADHGLHWGVPDLHRGGEARVIRSLGSALSRVVDVGAASGAWSAMVRGLAPQACVASFEIATPTRRRLLERFADDPMVHVAPVGLGRECTTASLHYYPDRPELSSLIRFPHGIDVEERAEEIVRGEDYLADRLGWQDVDYLKIDTEGAEVDVLRGFDRYLEARSISVVQFEYGRANIYRRTLLLDLHDLLEPHGFALGKIRPDGVEFRAYHPAQEDFFLCNYLAVREGTPLLLEALAGRWRSCLARS